MPESLTGQDVYIDTCGSIKCQLIMILIVHKQNPLSIVKRLGYIEYSLKLTHNM